MIRKVEKKYKFLMYIIDVLMISVAFFITPMIRFKNISLAYVNFKDINLILVLTVYLLILYILDMYELNLRQTLIRLINNLMISFIIIGIILSFIYYILPDIKLGRGLWMIQLSLSFVSLGISRLSTQLYLRKMFDKKRILVIGRNKNAVRVVEALINSSFCNYIGTITENKKTTKIDKKFKIIGSVSDIEKIFKKNNIDGIVVTDKLSVNKKVERIILKARMKGIQVFDIPAIIEILEQKIPVAHINDFWIIFNTFRGLNLNFYNKKFKRINDIIISFAGIVLLSPIWIITYLLVKLESPGPALYFQVRVGQNEKLFKIIKFRSMRQDAEKNGAVWAAKNDSRVTKVGKIIRLIRIDEIPQLWNVLKGDMTLIGPRPERPEFVEDLNKIIPYYSLRHMVKPGVSGWAQIKYPYGASVKDATEKLKYDLYYIRHLTFKLDMTIALKTIKTMLFGHGAR